MRADKISQTMCESGNNGIAAGMSISVIDALEVVDIADDDCQRHLVERRGTDHLLGSLLQTAAVEKTGKRIGQRLPLELIHEIQRDCGDEEQGDQQEEE